MIRTSLFLWFLTLLNTASAQQTGVQYEPVILNFEIETTSEKAALNPFLDYRLQVIFEQGDRVFSVPGFYAADGNAAETSAESGGTFRAIFTPSQPGAWTYTVYFQKGYQLAVEDDLFLGEPVAPHHGSTGTIEVAALDTDASGFNRSGRLTYNGSRYFHTEDGRPFLKTGANSPENFLAYEDIDGTYSYHPSKQFLKSWEPHLQDWNEGDPTWQNGKGKGIIGALNYLASKNMNAVYALTLNIEGDARDVWPFISHEKSSFKRYDVSKLAQWDIIFSHAEKLGIVMQLITQEKENELILDDGYTLVERKLYYRELVARFGYHQNIIWNMGEENGQANWWRQGQNDQQRFAMIRYLKDHDPYKNPLVIHTMSEVHDRDPILKPLVGFDRLDGLSMQVSNVYDIHRDIKDWIERSKKANRQWVVSMDEIGPWHTGTRPDTQDPKHDTLRQEVLWGTLLAGGAGVEWYFGWHTPPHDLNAEDWRSRENVWEQTSHALQFFNQIPYWEMESQDELIKGVDGFCFAKPGKVYAVYRKASGTAQLDLSNQEGRYDIRWFDPRNGGDLQTGTNKSVKAGGWVSLGLPPNESQQDWTILITKRS